MRRHHKIGNIRKHRGNPHGNAAEQKRPMRETSDDNLRQSAKLGVNEDSIRGKQ